MKTAAKQWFTVGAPKTITDDGVRVSGFSWLCPCGAEFLSHDVTVLVAAKMQHHQQHGERLRATLNGGEHE